MVAYESLGVLAAQESLCILLVSQNLLYEVPVLHWSLSYIWIMNKLQKISLTGLAVRLPRLIELCSFSLSGLLPPHLPPRILKLNCQTCFPAEITSEMELRFQGSWPWRESNS